MAVQEDVTGDMAVQEDVTGDMAVQEDVTGDNASVFSYITSLSVSIPSCCAKTTCVMYVIIN